MTLMQKGSGRAPFLMAGFEGKSVPSALAAQLRDGTAGGIVLFSRNLEGPRQVKELCREIRAAAGKGRPSPLIAIDQEGGRVTRLKDPGFTRFPPARSYSLFC
ncbi:MAG TPA: glycoside hydrolase family 3 N-terminal domain-containing protein, partial [Candidatus Deferrimicrobiaceae bacterium]